MLAQKKNKQNKKIFKKNQHNLYNKYLHIIIPKPQLNLIKYNIKLR